MMEDELKLNLAHQNLKLVPDGVVENYKEYANVVDVSNNKISDVSFLKNFKKLNSLILDHNRIESTVVFPYLPKVILLWMNFNKIEHLYPFINYLKSSFPSLKHLSLMGNPIVPPCREETYYEYVQYRLFVISCLEKLEHLDDRKVSQDERDEAHRLYKKRDDPKPFFRIPEAFTDAFTMFREYFNASPVITGQRYRNGTSSVI